MAKRKKLKYELIEGPVGDKIVRLIDQVRKAHHPELRDAKIQPAWMIENKPDADGRLVLGKMVTVAEVDRLMHGHDFKLLLNKEAWHSMKEEQREALVDHELSHGALQLDDDGEPREDADGRLLYRTRKHDLEEFRAVVARHGCYLDDIREFVEAVLDADPNLSLFGDDDTEVEISTGGKSVKTTPRKMRQAAKNIGASTPAN